MNLRRYLGAFLAVTLLATPAVLAQRAVVVEDDSWCSDEHGHWDDGDHYRHCEVREITLSSRDRLNVDAAPNGGISVIAWDEDQILVRAKVTASGKSPQSAAKLASDVEISTNGTIEADGPRSRDDEWYSVSFEIFAPECTDLVLESKNGGISIDGMCGRIRFETLNGGVSLKDVAGDVVGSTTNGGISVELAGESWDGRRLDVETTNGGVSITVPNGYSAELETGTVNGRISVDFPIMVEGTLDKRLNATLGEGGKTIRAVTTNGSVRITRG